MIVPLTTYQSISSASLTLPVSYIFLIVLSLLRKTVGCCHHSNPHRPNRFINFLIKNCKLASDWVALVGNHCDTFFQNQAGPAFSLELTQANSGPSYFIISLTIVSHFVKGVPLSAHGFPFTSLSISSAVSSPMRIYSCKIALWSLGTFFVS